MSRFFCCLLSFLFAMQIQCVAQSSHWTAQDVVQRGVLGITQKYAEFKIGSPAITEKIDHFGIQRNLYEVGTCHVTLGISKGIVVSVRMFVGKSCDLDVSRELRKPGIKLSQTTFADWGRPVEIHFVAPDAFPPCNGCGEYGSFVFGNFDAYGANGMVEMQLGGGDYKDKVFDAGYERWKDMIWDSGIDIYNLPLTGEFCPLRKFDEAGYRLMSKAKISSIGFGYHDTLQPACSAETDQRIRTTGDFVPINRK